MSKVKSRASNACELCRTRKSKCDELKPSCSNCAKKGITCTYGAVKPTRLESTLSGILSRISGVEEKLELLMTGGAVNSSGGSVTDLSSTLLSSNTSEGMTPSFLGFEDILTQLNTGSTDPFLIHELDKDIRSWNYDDSKVNHALDLDSEEEYSLRTNLNADPKLLESSSNFAPATLQKLKLSYLDHIYDEFPIVCYDKIKACEDYYKSKGLVTSFENCILLLVYSLGSLCSSSDSSYWKTESYQKHRITPEDLPLGFEYFVTAIEMKSKLESFHRTDFHGSLISLLSSIYYLKTGNLTSFWDEIQKSSGILHSVLIKEVPKNFQGLPDGFVDVCKRLFWINLHIERYVIEVTGLDNHYSSNLSKFQDVIGLPASCLPIPHDDGMYPSFVDERNYYLFCFMSNLLLVNLDEKRRELFKKYESAPIQEFLTMATKLKDDLITWMNQLPQKLNFENSIEKTVLLIKVNFYRIFLAVDLELLKRANNAIYIPADMEAEIRLISVSLLKTIRKIMKSISSFNFIDLSIFLAFDLLEIIKSMVENNNKFQHIPLGLTSDDYQSMGKAMIFLHPYTLHSKLFHERYLQVHKLILNS